MIHLLYMNITRELNVFSFSIKEFSGKRYAVKHNKIFKSTSTCHPIFIKRSSTNITWRTHHTISSPTSPNTYLNSRWLLNEIIYESASWVIRSNVLADTYFSVGFMYINIYLYFMYFYSLVVKLELIYFILTSTCFSHLQTAFTLFVYIILLQSKLGQSLGLLN